MTRCNTQDAMPEAGTMTLTVVEEEEEEEGLHGHGGSMEVLALPVALDRVGWGPFHWKFVVQCGLSWSCDMIEIALLSFLIPMVISGPAALPSSTPSPGFLLGGVTFAGELLGSLLFGVVSDLKGRRIGYLASTALIALAGLLCAASQNVETLVALRFFVGLGLGGVTCAFTLLSEVVGSAHRGKRIILSMGLLWTAGGVFATGAAWALDALIPDPNWQWRALVMVSAAPSLLLLLLFPWLVESPRFHLGAGKRQAAEETVRKIALANRASAFPRNFRLREPSAPSSRGEGATIARVLFGEDLWPTTLILASLWFLNMGSYYGICFVTPIYFKAQHDNEYVAAFVSSVSEVPGILAVSWAADGVGRRGALIAGYSVCAVATALLSLSAYLPYAALVTSAVFSRASAMASIMALYLYTPEVYPTQARNAALGLGSACSRVAGILVSYLSFRSETLASAVAAIAVYAASGKGK